MSSATVSIDIGQWEQADAEREKIFNDYATYMTTAYELDIKAMDDEADRLEGQLDDGWTDNASDDLKNFKQQVEDTWKEAQKYWEEFKTAYDVHLGSGNVAPHAVAPINLPIAMDAKRQVLENEVIAKLGDYEQTLAQSQIGANWSGKGAEGYAEQIPTQTKAMADLKATAERERDALDTSAKIQQAIFLSVMTSVKRVHYTVKDLDVDNTDDRWAERIYTMRDLNKDLKEWFDEFRDEFSSSWGSMQSGLISRIKETEGGYQELDGEDWPAATAESTGYTPDPNAGATGPGAGPGTGPGTEYPGGDPGSDYPGGDTGSGSDTGTEYPGGDPNSGDPNSGGMDTSGPGSTGGAGQQADKDSYE